MEINNKNNLYNKRGFTLVELLAVIVVLAVVMLIAINSILPQIDNARKNAFGIEVLGLADSAEQYVLEQQLTNTSFIVPAAGKCVTLTTLASKGLSDLKTEDYHGYVLVQRTGEGKYKYTVHLAKENGYYVDGVDGNTSVSTDAVKEDASKFASMESGCTTPFD